MIIKVLLRRISTRCCDRHPLVIDSLEFARHHKLVSLVRVQGVIFLGRILLGNLMVNGAAEI